MPTPRYNKIGNSSNIDESLFGNQDKFKGTRKVVTGPIPNNSIVLSQYEIDRLKKSAVILTEEQIIAQNAHREAIKAEKEKKARERKTKMIALEEVAKKNSQKTESQLIKDARDQAIKDMAEDKQINGTDVVKLLSTLGTRAAAFTIRDVQKQDKVRREQVESEHERRLDMMMEVDRIKDLQRREEEENVKRSKRHEDRKVITEQIEERRRMKLIAAEAREQENMAMRRMVEKYAEDDRVAAAKRQKEIERSRLEVIAANENAIERKRGLKQREIDEMNDVLRYQAEQDAKLAAREEDEARREHAKKEQQAKLLASQEKSQNKQAEIDELRARRAVEARERKVREQEREAARKKKEGLVELNQARARQAEDKKRQQDSLKYLEVEEIEDARRYAAKMQAREEREANEKARRAAEHRNGIMDQISEGDARRARVRQQKAEEGSGNRAEFITESTKLETIRQKMVKDLEAEGVNPDYLTEMKNLDIKKILSR
jgi:hypothetical protein